MVEQYIDGGLYNMDDEKRDYEERKKKEKFIHERFEFGISLEEKIKNERELENE